MIRVEMKKYNTILTEKQQKYKHYSRVKLINMNILQEKNYYLLIRIELHRVGQKKNTPKIN